MTPNVDRNLAPETWITAAPVDTLTLKDSGGRQLPPDPTVHIIPVRFHMYWAGSDPDGTVVGFYYAVTETTATPDPLTNAIPPLPGPKPHDYHYTTRTDTTFIFNVTEGAPDRQHAFFIYAVDDGGKADPTPARFMFTAIDKFPPTPIFDLAQAIGTIYQYEGSVSYVNGQLVGGTLVAHPDIKNFTDQSIPRTTVRDSGAVNSVLRFRWHVKLGIAGTFVKKYCYRLEETEFSCFPPSVDSAVYAGPFSAGTKVFTLRTVDQAGGARDSTRRFTLNYMPDTWFSGPDPNDSRFVQTREGTTGDIRYIDMVGVDWTTWPGLSGTLMHRDSIKVLPLHRQPRKSFFEIYNGRLYAHAENDTVHMNSWVIFYNGGYDRDSKYAARVDPLDPALPPVAERPNYPVLVPGPENGSPIGFRSQVVLSTDINGQQVNFAQSGMYPIYEPTSVFRALTIGGYWPMFLSGKAYALARAEDGNGQSDRQVADARTLADLVDGDGGTVYDRNLREREVMTFYVNKSPFFLTKAQEFRPIADPADSRYPTTFTGAIWNAGQPEGNLNLPSDDSDPYDSNEQARTVGKPTNSKVLRYKISVLGKDFTTGRDTSFVWDGDPGGADSPYYFWLRNSPVPPTLFIVPCYIAGGPVKIQVQLCDCRDCEHIGGQGRCITQTFDATYVRTYTVCSGPSSPDRGGTR